MGTFLSLLFLTFVNFLTYHRWFDTNNILTWGDWGFVYPETLLSMLPFPQTWASISSLGTVNIGLTFAPKYFLNGLIAKIGLYDWNNQITYFFPIVFISAWGMFILGKKIFKSNLAGVITSIAFNFNVIVLGIRSGHLTMASAHAFAPFVLIKMLDTLRTKKFSDALYTGILCVLVGINEVRVLYLVSFVIALYFVFDTTLITRTLKNLIINLKLAVTIFGVLLIGNLYWLLPFINTHRQAGDAFGFLGRQLFGSGHYNLLTSFTSWNIWWTGSTQASSVQPISVIFWIIPILAFAGLMLNKNNRDVLFFGVIALIGIFFAKQIDHPFTGVYHWLYIHFPGFNAFRESSKFFYLVVLGYSVMIGGFVHSLVISKAKIFSSKILKIAVVTTVSMLFLYNSRPFVTDQIGTVFAPRHIPADHLTLRNAMLESDNYYRTVWIPANSRWGVFTREHPKVSLIDLVNNEWKFPSQTFRESSTKIDEEDIMIYTLLTEDFKLLLRDYSVKYLVVPTHDLENDDNLFAYFGDRNKYLQALDSLSYIRKSTLPLSDLVVYENLDYRPHFYTSFVSETSSEKDEVIQLSETQFTESYYSVQLPGENQDYYVNFSENYHSDWKLILGPIRWYQYYIPVFDPSSIVLSERTSTGTTRFLISGSRVSSTPTEAHVIFYPQIYANLGLFISVTVVTFVFLLATFLSIKSRKP